MASLDAREVVMPVLIAKLMMINTAHWYYILCAVFTAGGLFALFFAGENFSKHAAGISTWVLTGFLTLVGVVLLYVGFSSFIEFFQGHHSTIDSVIDNVDTMGRFFRV